MNIVLFQPDIALNVGAAIRLSGCLNANLHIIEPCGFPFNMKKIRESALDYIEKIEIKRHISLEDFLKSLNKDSRILTFSTKAKKYYHKFKFRESDYLLFGSESAGVTDSVIEKSDELLKIPLKEGFRSLNLVTAISIVAGEFLRQLDYKDLN